MVQASMPESALEPPESLPMLTGIVLPTLVHQISVNVCCTTGTTYRFPSPTTIHCPLIPKLVQYKYHSWYLGSSITFFVSVYEERSEVVVGKLHEIWLEVNLLMLVHMICEVLMFGNKGLEVFEVSSNKCQGVYGYETSSILVLLLHNCEQILDNLGTAGEILLFAGIAGVVEIVGVVIGPLRKHFVRHHHFGLVSMYRKNCDRHCAYRPVASIGGRSLDPAAIMLLCI
ncbi:hypothetical protein Tco_0067102 [Tanacetum coccineum]